MDEMKDFSARYAADLKAALTTARAEAEGLRAELAEQARIVGMSAERELALRAEIARLRAYVKKAEGVFRDYELQHQRKAGEIITMGHSRERDDRLNKAARNGQMADEALAALGEQGQ